MRDKRIVTFAALYGGNKYTGINSKNQSFIVMMTRPEPKFGVTENQNICYQKKTNEFRETKN
jgi:hypothetical protein